MRDVYLIADNLGDFTHPKIYLSEIEANKALVLLQQMYKGVYADDSVRKFTINKGV
jgi:hypothetical protein